MLIFDNYLWQDGPGEDDILNAPELAIDAFVNIFGRQINVIGGQPLYRLAIGKRLH